MHLIDEISLGSIHNPAEVDIHPLSLGWYRRWLSHRYGAIQNLNNAGHVLCFL